MGNKILTYVASIFYMCSVSSISHFNAAASVSSCAISTTDERVIRPNSSNYMKCYINYYSTHDKDRNKKT
jgi:hypothetical protein